MRFEPPDAECLIYTFKEGLLSAIAHDLAIRVGRLSVELGGAEGPLQARFDAGSLRVVSAMAGGVPTSALSDGDRRTIERNLADEVLDARHHPEIRFVARSVSGEGDRRRVEGTLTLRGRQRPLGFEVVRGAGEGGVRWRAEVRLHQPDFGIKPYSAMLGTLKIRPDVLVKLSLPASAAPPESPAAPDDEPPQAA